MTDAPIYSRPNHPKMACEACVYGWGEHADWCLVAKPKTIRFIPLRIKIDRRMPINRINIDVDPELPIDRVDIYTASGTLVGSIPVSK